jgi:hypothetical protein
MSCCALSRRTASVGKQGPLIKARTTLTQIKMVEFLDALRELGIIKRALEVVGIQHMTLWQAMHADESLAEQIRQAQEEGRAKRKDYLETLAYAMAPTNPTMVMFLLKREDPSYRESYNVNSTSQPTSYVVDLGLPDDTTPITDVTPAEILE